MTPGGQEESKGDLGQTKDAGVLERTLYLAGERQVEQDEWPSSSWPHSPLALTLPYASPQPHLLYPRLCLMRLKESRTGMGGSGSCLLPRGEDKVGPSPPCPWLP